LLDHSAYHVSVVTVNGVTFAATADMIGGVTAPLGIRVDSVEAWFRDHVPGVRPPLRYDRVTGGHSCLTYVVTDADDGRYVLRRPPVGDLLATAHDVVREHRIMAALADTDVPVPRMLGVCEDADITGAPFFVMAYVDGFVLHVASDAEQILPSRAARTRAGETLVDALAALHGVDVDAVGLTDLTRPHGYLDRQLKRWSTQWTASGLAGDDADRVYGWLVEHRPAERPARIVHGDFRLGNALVGRDGSVLAILDWEVCALGEPLSDLAYLLRWWSTPDVRNPDEGTPSTIAGFPSTDDLAARYGAQSGRSLDHLDYWMTFATWRAAAMLAGVYRRYVDGTMGDRPENLSLFPVELERRIAQAMAFANLVS
jgi:aminoglycoside phosphotransferase (APT) family kinase protein